MCCAQELNSYAQGQGHHGIRGQIVIEHNMKVYCTQKLGSYAQGQGHNQVRGQIVPKIVLLINYSSKFDKSSQKD